MLKNKKKGISVILSLLLVFALVVAAQAAAPVQNANGYYELATVEDMLWFREQVAQGEVDMNAMLTADIDLSGMSWQPIWYEDGVEDVVNFNPNASLDYAYNGTFDGNGKTLTLKFDNDSLVNAESAARYHTGLFLHSNEDAVVKNLNLTGSIDISGTVATDRLFAAFLSAGWRGAVYNCQVKDATIQFANTSNFFIAALLAGMGTNTNVMPIGSVPATAIVDSCVIDNVKIQNSADSVDNGAIGILVGGFAHHAVVQNSEVRNNSSIYYSSDTATNQVTLAAIGFAQTKTNEVRYCKAADIIIDADTPNAAVYISGISTNGAAFIIGNKISNSKLLARGNVILIGGIAYSAGASSFSAGDYVYIKDCVVDNVDIKGTITGTGAHIGGIVANAYGNSGIQNNRVINSKIYGVVENTSTINSRTFSMGGIVARSMGNPSVNDLREVIGCVSQNNDIQWSVSGDLQYAATAYMGGVIGYTSVADAPVTIENSVVLGGTISADASQMTTRASTLYVGGLMGQNRSAKVRSNSVVLDTVTLQKGTLGTSAIYAGALSGRMIGSDAGANRAEHIGNRYGDDFFNSAYTWTAAPGTAGGYDPAADPNKSTYCYENDNEAYDQDALASTLDTLFVLLGGISDPLTMRFGQSITIDPLASLGEAQYNGITVEPIANGIISVTENIDGTVTITATGVGTTSVYISYMTASGMKTELFNVTVTATPEYAYTTAVITGTPSDGVIYPGEEVNLTYDFSPYIAIPEIDNSGMALSGLLAAIVDGKVVLTGTAGPAGTYYYVVKLQGTDGSVITQTVYVTIQGGSRPTGYSSGGGSSNCNAGLGLGALLSLLGLAVIQKRK